MDMFTIALDCVTHGEVEALQYGTRLPRCPRCVESEIAERQAKRKAEQDEELRLQRIEAADVSVPLRYRNSKLSDFSEATAAKVNAWIDRCRADSGALMVFGPVGTGKTHLACAITRALVINGPAARYVSQANYLRKIRETWDDKTKSEEDVFSSYISPRVLVLDDIGAARANDNDTLRLGELISERYDAAKPSVFVTNLTPVELKTAVGDRAYDRMRHNAVQLVLNGETRRKAA